MKGRDRMTLFRTITAALIWIAALGGAAAADTWPQRYVRIIVPFAAGGAADVVTRIVAARIAENLGKSVVVENRTGSNGNIGTEAVARSEPDGYTFLAGSPGTLAINPNMFAKLPYNALTDFVTVSHVATFPQVLAVSRKIPAANLSDFIAYVKARPKALNFGIFGHRVHRSPYYGNVPASRRPRCRPYPLPRRWSGGAGASCRQRRLRHRRLADLPGTSSAPTK